MSWQVCVPVDWRCCEDVGDLVLGVGGVFGGEFGEGALSRDAWELLWCHGDRKCLRVYKYGEVGEVGGNEEKRGMIRIGIKRPRSKL